MFMVRQDQVDDIEELGGGSARKDVSLKQFFQQYDTKEEQEEEKVSTEVDKISPDEEKLIEQIYIDAKSSRFIDRRDDSRAPDASSYGGH